MSDPAAAHIPDSFTRSTDPATAGAPRRRARTIARSGAVLTAATAMTIATLGLAAPAGAAPTPSAAAVTGLSAFASPGTGSAASHQKAQPATTSTRAVGNGGWSPTGSMITPRVWGGEAAALLADGRVLVTGGYDGYFDLPETRALSSSELYNPATGTWTATGSLLQPLAGATAITLANGNVLLVGGGTAQTQLFNPTTGTWTAGASMPSPLVGIGAGRLLNGRVIVTGTGSNPSRPSTPSALEYNPANNTWASLRQPPNPLFFFGSGSIDGSTVLPKGQFFTHFGSYGSSVYTRATNSWKQLKTRGMNLADHSQIALLPNGHVMIASGTYYDFVNSFSPSQAVYDLNPASGKWTQLATLPRPHEFHAFVGYDGSKIAQLGNGSILATGGDSAADLDYVYSPKANTWSAVPGRYSANATLITLANGSVLDTSGSIFTP